MALNIVAHPYQYFGDPDAGRPIAGGDVYVGIVDLDPTILANQKSVTLRQEDGTEVSVSQPISLSAGGYPTFNGSPVAILVDGDYSIAVLDSLGVQKFYSPSSPAGFVLTSDNSISVVDTIADLAASSFESGVTVKARGNITAVDGITAEFFVDTTGDGVTLANGNIAIYQDITPLPDVATLVTLNLPSGLYVETKGYTTAGEGGARYLIQTAAEFGATPDEQGDHTLANGNIAVLQRVGGKIPSARQYGCALDGVTVDTTAFAAYIAANAGKQIHVYDGTLLTDTQQISNKITINLHSGATIKAINSSAAGGLITFNTSGSKLIGGGTIDGNRANQTLQCDGVRFTASDCRVSGITIKDTFRYGIRGIAVDDCEVSGVTVENAGDVGIGFIYSGTTGVSRNRITNCLVDSVGDLTTQGGIKIIGNAATTSPSTNNIVANNTVLTPTQICIEFFGNCRAGSVSGNSTRGGTMGVSIDASESVAVSGNSIWAPTSNGIELAGCDRCSIVGNSIEGANSTDNGIILSGGGSQHSVITGNSIHDFQTKGILISDGSDGTTITGNVVSTGTSTGIGMDLQSNNLVITSNVVDGNSVQNKNIVVDNHSNIIFSNNRLFGATTQGIEVIATSGTVNNISVTGGLITDSSNRFKLTSSGGTFGKNIKIWNVEGLTDKYYFDFFNNIFESYGTGTPEGVVSASVGSTFRRTDGGASTVLYVKESGTGNTGWVAK